MTGTCRECVGTATLLVLVASFWLGWFVMNGILAENLETADSFLNFVQIGNVIGEMQLSWPARLSLVFNAFGLMDFDVRRCSRI